VSVAATGSSWPRSLSAARCCPRRVASGGAPAGGGLAAFSGVAADGGATASPVEAWRDVLRRLDGANAPLRYDAPVPKLACWSCGRQLYTVSPLESLFAEERRCPRCGAFLNPERREADRRSYLRRQNPPDDPGPPDGAERRAEDRRVTRRRRTPTS
jgi:hypothetical protein